MKWRNRNPNLSDELSRLRALSPREVLRVGPHATMEEIKAAYRTAMKAYHPDKADPFMRRHNEEITRIIIQAYKDLINEHKGSDAAALPKT
jgi:DnaJ-class molecular chaperone